MQSLINSLLQRVERLEGQVKFLQGSGNTQSILSGLEKKLPPEGGVSGQVLRKRSGTSYDYEWTDVVVVNYDGGPPPANRTTFLDGGLVTVAYTGFVDAGGP